MTDRMAEVRKSLLLACVLEATARKPGNAHVYAHVKDLHYGQFLEGGVVVADALSNEVENGVGHAILAAVRESRNVARTNFNLGIILVLAPLAAAALRNRTQWDIEEVLDHLTVEDARNAYQAIREAEPGGLGNVDDQDIAGEPTINLRQAMALAADRDSIARQYAGGYVDLFNVGLPAFAETLQRRGAVEDAIIACQLTWMEKLPDSLIERRHGRETATMCQRRAGQLLETLQRHPPDGPFAEGSAVTEFDRWMRSRASGLNPGTSADLVAATLFWSLITGRWTVAGAPFVGERSR